MRPWTERGSEREAPVDTYIRLGPATPPWQMDDWLSAKVYRSARYDAVWRPRSLRVHRW